ncbi:hypothetical protein, partial [Chromatium okenii]|uniref:hypothetical protein n=1 Tax=Chromatium okenii TaxID=61644 RepID=UPI0026EAC40F
FYLSYIKVSVENYQMINTRRGEQLGWKFGWLGGFIWVAVLSGVFFWQGKWLESASGVLLSITAIAAIHKFAPWHYPTQPYWKLMLAPYSLMGASIVWAIWVFGGITANDFNAWSLLSLLPLLIPFGTLSRRTWVDGEPPSHLIK